MLRPLFTALCRLGLLTLPGIALLPAALVAQVPPAPAPGGNAYHQTIRRLYSSQDPAPTPDQGASAKTHDVWLGLRCQPMSNELREQIRVEPGLGLMVKYVAPEGPAAKAGIRAGDVVMAVGERLARTEQLAQAIARAQAGVMRLQIYREGRVQGIEVKLALRPADQPAEETKKSVVVPAEESKERMVEIRREVRVLPPDAPKPAAPGHAPRIAVLAPPALPENVKVTIDKRKGEPAVIVVEQEGKTFKATERDLSPLPESVRVFVHRTLGRAAVVPGAGELRTIELKVDGKDEKGQPGEVKKFELKLDGKGPAGVTPKIRELPDGRIEIELHGAGDKKPDGALKPDSKRSERAPEKPNPVRDLREIEEKIQALRLEVERLRKAVKE